MKDKGNGRRAGRAAGPSRPGLFSFVRIEVLAGMLGLWALLLGSAGCGDNQPAHSPASLPTRGALAVGIDESLRPFSQAEIDMFCVYYPDAEVTPSYLSEKRVVEKLLANEIQTAILCRDLTSEEKTYLTGTYGHTARSFKLAEDAIVAVVNPENPVRTLPVDALRRLVSGSISRWDQLPGSIESPLPIIVVLTGSSSIDRYFSTDAPLSPEATYALETTGAVIEYVENNVSAIGLLGGSWFYQKGNENKNVRILAYSTNPAESDTPVPLREVYAITHEPNTGLGSGFISFMAGQKGQLILSKAGMTPYKPIEREIQITNSF